MPSALASSPEATQMQRTGGYSNNVQIKLPSTNDAYIRYNIESRRNKVAADLQYQFLSMIFPGIDLFTPQSLVSNEKLLPFLEKFDEAGYRQPSRAR